jgi:hypothetical protein
VIVPFYTGAVGELVEVPDDDFPAVGAVAEIDASCRTWYDFRGKVYARLQGRVAEAGPAGSKLGVQFYNRTSSAWEFLDGASGPILTVTATGDLYGPDVVLTSAARAVVLVRLVMTGVAEAEASVWSDAFFRFTSADLSTLTDGDPIAAWPDYAGIGGRDATQATSAAQPTYAADGLGPGLPAVYFSGAQWLDLPDLSGLTSEAEIFIVLKTENDPTATPTGTGPGLWYLSTQNFKTAYPYLDGKIYDGAGTNFRYTVGDPTPALTTPHVYNVSVGHNTSWEARLDGTLLFTGTAPTMAMVTAPRLGASVNDSYCFQGWIADFVVFPTRRTAGQREDILAALKDLHGLTGY